jgi:hypothetical protein
MEAMRESWTDDRLDHLSERMDERFDRVDERFRQVDQRFEQVDQRFEQVDRRFEQVDRRLERVEAGLDRNRTETRAELAAMRTTLDTRFDTTQYMIIRVSAGLFATMLFGFLSLLLTRI